MDMSQGLGNTDSSKNPFNFDRQCSHFIQATEAINHYNAVLMATEPKFEEMPIKWAPYCPSVLRPEDMDLWACSKTVFDDVVADDIYATDEKIYLNACGKGDMINMNSKAI